MNCSDNAITIMPAAISVLKPPVSDEYGRWVGLLMANQPPLKRNPNEWPALEVAAASKSPPRSRGWRKSRPPGVEGGDAHEQKLDEEAHGQELDEAEAEVPQEDFPYGKNWL